MLTVAPTRTRREPEPARFRRALCFLAMTLFLPGSAQFARGNRTIGRTVLLLDALLLVGSVVGWLVLGRDGVVRLLLQPTFLVAVQVMVLLVLLGWLALFADAVRLGRPPSLTRTHRVACGGLALTLMGMVGAPLAYGSQLLGAHRDVLDTIFTPGPTGRLAEGRLNVLLLGGDGGRGRTGIRADSITVASVDVATGRTVLFSVPRNLQGVRFPPNTSMAAQFPRGFPDFLFGVYTYAAEHPALFSGVAEPGPEAIKQAVSQTLGIPLHYYVLMNLAGFQAAVDALGGITIRVDQRLPIGGGTAAAGDSRYPTGTPLPILGYIEPGLQKLNGYRALWYARSRSSTDDYDRMARQRCVLGAILREADPLTVVKNYKALAASAKNLIQTDLTTGALGELVTVAGRTRETAVTSLALTPPLVRSVNPDVDAVHALVGAAIDTSANPTASRAAPTEGSTTGAATGGRAPSTSAPVTLDSACDYD